MHSLESTESANVPRDFGKDVEVTGSGMDWSWESHFDSRESSREREIRLECNEPVVVPHPFGRGQFRELAKKAVVPGIVLEAILKKHGEQPSWSSSATWKGGGGTTRQKMGGVKKTSGARTTLSPSKPKTSCRGRALKMRAEKSRMPRPGASLSADVKERVNVRSNNVTTSSYGGGTNRSSLPLVSQRRSIKDDRISRTSEPLLVQTEHRTREEWNTYNSKWPSLKASRNISCFSDCGSNSPDVLSDNSLHFSPPPASISTAREEITLSRYQPSPTPDDTSEQTKKREWIPISRKREEPNGGYFQDGWAPVTRKEETCENDSQVYHPQTKEETNVAEQPKPDWWFYEGTEEEAPVIKDVAMSANFGEEVCVIQNDVVSSKAEGETPALTITGHSGRDDEVHMIESLQEKELPTDATEEQFEDASVPPPGEKETVGEAPVIEEAQDNVVLTQPKEESPVIRKPASITTEEKKIQTPDDVNAEDVVPVVEQTQNDQVATTKVEKDVPAVEPSQSITAPENEFPVIESLPENEEEEPAIEQLVEVETSLGEHTQGDAVPADSKEDAPVVEPSDVAVPINTDVIETLKGNSEVKENEQIEDATQMEEKALEIEQTQDNVLSTEGAPVIEWSSAEEESPVIEQLVKGEVTVGEHSQGDAVPADSKEDVKANEQVEDDGVPLSKEEEPLVTQMEEKALEIEQAQDTMLSTEDTPVIEPSVAIEVPSKTEEEVPVIEQLVEDEASLVEHTQDNAVLAKPKKDMKENEMVEGACIPISKVEEPLVAQVEEKTLEIEQAHDNMLPTEEAPVIKQSLAEEDTPTIEPLVEDETPVGEHTQGHAVPTKSEEDVPLIKNNAVPSNPEGKHTQDSAEYTPASVVELMNTEDNSTTVIENLREYTKTEKAIVNEPIEAVCVTVSKEEEEPSLVQMDRADEESPASEHTQNDAVSTFIKEELPLIENIAMTIETEEEVLAEHDVKTEEEAPVTEHPQDSLLLSEPLEGVEAKESALEAPTEEVIPTTEPPKDATVSLGIEVVKEHYVENGMPSETGHSTDRYSPLTKDPHDISTHVSNQGDDGVETNVEIVTSKESPNSSTQISLQEVQYVLEADQRAEVDETNRDQSSSPQVKCDYVPDNNDDAEIKIEELPVIKDIRVPLSDLDVKVESVESDPMASKEQERNASIVDKLSFGVPSSVMESEPKCGSNSGKEALVIPSNEQLAPQNNTAPELTNPNSDSNPGGLEVESDINNSQINPDTSLDDFFNLMSTPRTASGNKCPKDKVSPSDILPNPESPQFVDGCSPSLPAHVCAAATNQEELLGWSLDNQSLYFSNLPSYVTAKELEQMIEPFGTISHCTVLREVHDNTMAAYVRMEKKSACNWVISCFHGNPYDESPLQIQCDYALAEESTDYTLGSYEV